jgi:hypothetical protein
MFPKTTIDILLSLKEEDSYCGVKPLRWVPAS